jgi:HSP20 family protein
VAAYTIDLTTLDYLAMWVYEICSEAYRSSLVTKDNRTDDVEVEAMFMRTDPFREFDRIAQQLVGAGTTSRPVVMPMDAWREGDTFVLEFDLPGVQPETLDIDVERNVLTIKAERPARTGDGEPLAAERPTGLFSRQLVLGDNLDLDQVKATYDAGVLQLRVPVAAKAMPRKIDIATSGGSEQHQVTAGDDTKREQSEISS